MSINLVEHISKTTNINATSIKNVLALLNESCTIPFIARYRKEKTGELDEVKIQTIKTIADYFEELNERKETILKAIIEQEKLTPELEKQINDCNDKQILEDLYFPYKKKKLTKAMIAISKGLEPLANIIFGLPTLKDIIKELKKPGLDPREKFKYATFLEGINEISDLRPGMTLEGIITNVTNFGAFVDIGVHQDGLIHISKLSNTFVKDPNDIVSVGQAVSVKIIEADVSRKRISLEKINSLE